VHPLDAGQRGVLFFMIKQKIIETKWTVNWAITWW
jgi:hypothetical protein